MDINGFIENNTIPFLKISFKEIKFCNKKKQYEKKEFQIKNCVTKKTCIVHTTHFIIPSDVLKIIISILFFSNNKKNWRKEYKFVILVCKTFYQTALHLMPLDKIFYQRASHLMPLGIIFERNNLDYKEFILKIFPFFSYTKMLLSLKKWDISMFNNMGIRLASENGYDKIVELLLEYDEVDPSVDKNYVIRWASYYGYYKTVKLLLEDKRVDPSVECNCAILNANTKKHENIVDLLINDKRVNPTLLNKNEFILSISSNYYQFAANLFYFHE